MKFILLINVKMPTIVGILTFISRMNTTSESIKARKTFFKCFTLNKQFKFHAQLLSMKKNNLGLGVLSFFPFKEVSLYSAVTL